MFENLSEFVGYAMHDDLLRTRKGAHAVEAARMLKERRRGSMRSSYREAMARALVAMATRLAPSVGTRAIVTTE
jgi:Arc/MetJ-type ribon-helix-helix transcriptional regulator